MGWLDGEMAVTSILRTTHPPELRRRGCVCIYLIAAFICITRGREQARAGRWLTGRRARKPWGAGGNMVWCGRAMLCCYRACGPGHHNALELCGSGAVRAMDVSMLGRATLHWGRPVLARVVLPPE